MELRDYFLATEDLAINVVGVNNKFPMECAMEPCAPSELNHDCLDYWGSCPPDAPALAYNNWQGLMRVNKTAEMPLFQDTQDADVWNREYGGGHDDLFIYDGQGKLYAYVCSSKTCSAPFLDNSLMTPGGYENIKSLIGLAARSSSSLRCDSSWGGGVGGGEVSYKSKEISRELLVALVAMGGLLLGIFIGLFASRCFALVSSYFFPKSDNTKRFIQLSTIDDDTFDHYEE